jgi:hypothetical protein
MAELSFFKFNILFHVYIIKHWEAVEIVRLWGRI